MRRIQLTVAVILLLVATASGQTIHTFAGGAIPNNIPAASAWLSQPSGVATDSLGNLYVVTSGQSIVFQVNSAGYLTLMAGNGTDGYSGDGGPATSAQLYFPTGVAVDTSGNIFIADNDNFCVRRVDVGTGVISTVAGNGSFGFSGDGDPATEAELSFTYGVAVDTAGDLFIADFYYNRIRRVDGKTGIITTVAGGGTSIGDGGPATSAMLSSPQGVAVDTSGNLFIADAGDVRIRRVDVKTGIITTVAGNGQTGSNGKGDGGLATKASFEDPVAVWLDMHNNIFVADDFDERVRRVNGKSGIITTVAGNSTQGFKGDGGLATSANLNSPESVTVDPSGNILIADYGNQRVRRVDAVTGIISTVTGNGTPGDGKEATTAGLALPAGLALDPSGNVFIADSYDSRIRLVDAETGIISTVAGNGLSIFFGDGGDGGPAASASFYAPSGVALDASGDIFIADYCLVRRVDAQTGIITTVAGDLSMCTSFSGDGGPATSAGLAIFSPFAATGGIVVDNSGNLFIADSGNQRIRRVDATTGIITTVAGNGQIGFSGDGGPATSANLNFSVGVTVDGSANLFIADTFNNRIRRVDAVTRIITTVAGSGPVSQFPLFQRHSREGGNPFGPSSAGQELLLKRGMSMAWIPAFAGMTPLRGDDSGEWMAGNIKLTDYAAAGNGTYGYGGDGGPATNATLSYHFGVALDGRGNVFIADTLSGRIRRVDALSGIINTVAGNGTFGFSGDDGPAASASLGVPYAVAMGNSGKLLTADTYNNRVRSVDPFPWAVALPASLKFRGQPLGTTSAKMKVTLTNTGNATLSLNLAITGPNSGDFSLSDNCRRYMEAGANCSISVTFRPSGTGSRIAAITIINNAPDNPQMVSLSGFGIRTGGVSPLNLTPSD